MRVAYFSPLPPTPSGISDYSRDLLPDLCELADVTVVAEDADSLDTGVLGRASVVDHREFDPAPQAQSRSINIYQMGNSPCHRYMYPFILKYPGIVVLHDYVLHHFVWENSIGIGKTAGYLREMGYSMGRDGLDSAHRVLAGKATPMFFQHPLSERVLDASFGLIVHSSYVRDLVLRTRPSAKVKVVPMGMPLPEVMPRNEARALLGLSKDSFIVASFGQASPHKRIDVVARAVAKLRVNVPDSLYIIAGSTVPGFDVSRVARDLGIEDVVKITGFTDSQSFTAFMMAADVCVNLRYPTAGETSASALRAMAAGRATIISDVGAAQDIPDSVCIKIDIGADEEEQLLQHLKTFAENKGAADSLGETARKYIAENHTLQGAARRYVSFINEVVDSPISSSKSLAGFIRNDPDEAVLDKIARDLDALAVTRQDRDIIGMVSELVRELGIKSVNG
ncbi:MAG: glycosyltransferase [Dehalococcoidia bacterium]|nr:glycosyltransferase [Dehalococcoidia bacterium]